MMGMGRGRIILNANRKLIFNDYTVTGDENAFANRIESIYNKLRGLTTNEATKVVERLQKLGVSVENFDGNNPTNKVLVSVVTDLIEATVAVIPTFTNISAIEAVNKHDGVRGSYKESQGKLTLNIAYNKERDLFMRGMFTTCTQVGTVTHEFGHAIRSYLHNNHKEAIRVFEEHVTHQKMNALSAYGSIDISNAFAESFSAFVHGTPRTNKFHRAFENLMAEVGLSTLGNLMHN